MFRKLPWTIGLKIKFLRPTMNNFIRRLMAKLTHNPPQIPRLIPTNSSEQKTVVDMKIDEKKVSWNSDKLGSIYEWRQLRDPSQENEITCHTSIKCY